MQSPGPRIEGAPPPARALLAIPSVSTRMRVGKAMRTAVTKDSVTKAANVMFGALTKLLHFLQCQACTIIGLSPSGRLTQVDQLAPCVDINSVGFEFQFFIDHIMVHEEMDDYLVAEATRGQAHFRKRLMMRINAIHTPQTGFESRSRPPVTAEMLEMAIPEDLRRGVELPMTAIGASGQEVNHFDLFVLGLRTKHCDF